MIVIYFLRLKFILRFSCYNSKEKPDFLSFKVFFRAIRDCCAYNSEPSEYTENDTRLILVGVLLKGTRAKSWLSKSSIAFVCVSSDVLENVSKMPDFHIFR